MIIALLALTLVTLAAVAFAVVEAEADRKDILRELNEINKKINKLMNYR